jgi:hypothetical protein
MNLYNRFKELIVESKPEFDKKSMKTQVATTGSAYERVAKAQQAADPSKNKKILVYGAGLQTTTEGVARGSNAEENKHTVHDFEPFPDRRKYAPTFTKDEDIHKDYHEIYCGNVHNVVKPEVAHHITKNILGSLREGGTAFIGTRKTHGDVAAAKQKEPVQGNPDAFLIGKDKVYQEGYDFPKLKSHIEGVAKEMGHDVEVTKHNFCATGAKVVLKQKSK